MRKISISRESVVRYAITATGGLLLTLAFPNWDVAGMAWIGPGVMLMSALGATGKQAFRLGYVGGLIHALTALYWLLKIPYTFHGIPIGPAAGWLSLSAYVALYPALWVWCCWRVFPRSPQPQQGGGIFAGLSHATWVQRATWSFGCAAIWTGLEIIRACFLSGFPWNLLGASQFRIWPLIQSASFGGIYIVSFLIVWTSVAIALALVGLVARRRPVEEGASIFPGLKAGSLMQDVAVPLLVVAGVVSYGASRAMQSTGAGRELKVALVQPSVPQTLIWDDKADAERLKKALQLSEQALAAKPDLLVWPESAFPSATSENLAALCNMVTAHQVWTIFCSDDVDPPRSPGDVPKYYNASFLISPKGEILERYRKRRLVIFGEYIPLVKWLPFLKWVTPIDGGFTPGPGPVPFNLTNPAVNTSVLICFEDMFPAEARDHVKADTDVLINLTNDGWFGEGAEQWQQAASAVFRAVENGVPLIRCTNNGITCWIDAQGRIREIGPKSIFGPGYVIGTIPLPGRGERSQTFYNRYGDWFGWGCAAYGVLLLARGFRKNSLS